MKRFYKEVSVAAFPAATGGEAYGVLLDGRPIKTPGKATLAVPTRALAEAIAEEWRVQGDKVELEAMPLTKLANTAIDRVPAHQQAIVEQIVGYARTDLLSYRAEHPAGLVALQAKTWDPLLKWLADTYGAQLSISHGIAFIEQPAEALIALEQVVWKHDAYALTALHMAASMLGSLTLGLALSAKHLSATEALDASHVDDNWQAEKWGRDAEAEKRRAGLLTELQAAERFMRLVQTQS